MRGLRAWLVRWAGLLGKARRDREFAAEIESHLQMHIDDNLHVGMTPEQARREALMKLGGVEQTKESYRERRGLPWLEALLQDVRFGLRMMRRNPGFTAVAVLTLALGIGANTAIFSVVNAVLLRPLPYREPNQLVDLYSRIPQSDQALVTYPIFLYWQREMRTMEVMAAWTDGNVALTGMGAAARLPSRGISAGYFGVLGVHPILGRDFQVDDDRLGAPRVVLVSEGFWKDRLGASRTILGNTLTLNENQYTIVGVIPSSARLWRSADVYVPIGQSVNPSFANRGPQQLLAVIGRLRPGATLEQAKAELEIVDKNRIAAFPDSAGITTGINLHSLRQDVIGNLQPTLLLLLGAVGFVMLIACANVANLLLARSSGRTREFAIRAAVGASRGRIIRHLLTESVLLFLIGGAAGLLLAELGIRSALSFLPAVQPQMLRVSMDARVLAFALLTSLVTGILFGLVPAKTSLSNPQEALRKGGWGDVTGRHTAQTILILVEISLALVLLVGAGLMIRTMTLLWRVNPGFDAHNVMAFTVAFPPSSKPDPEAIRVRNREIAEQVAALPGVESVGICNGALPMSGLASSGPVWRPDQAPPANGSQNLGEVYAVGSGYFRAMKIPLLQGRVFTAQDDHAAPMVVIIDENLARRLFPAENPVGKRLNMGRVDQAQIVGVVGHVKHFGLDGDSRALVQLQFYQPFDQEPDVLAPVLERQATFVMRTSVPPTTLIDAVRHAVSEMDSHRIVYGVQLMDDMVADSQSERRFSMALLGVFAGVALMLAGIGIYGVISSLAARRTNEIGIRIALGARPGDVLWLVMQQGFARAALGVAIGIVAAFGLTRLMARLLYGVSATDALTFAGVTALLLAVALLVCYIPARRAARVDPMAALRHE